MLVAGQTYDMGVRLSAVVCTFGYTFGCHVAQNLLRSMLQQDIGKAAAIAAISAAHTDCNKCLLATDIC